MLTKDDLKEIRGAIAEEINPIKEEMAPIKKELKEISRRTKRIDKTLSVAIKSLNGDNMSLPKRVKKIEDHLGLSSKN